jgi:undecaprenyl-diphosphatase
MSIKRYRSLRVLQYATLVLCVIVPILGRIMAASARQTAAETAFLVSIHMVPSAVSTVSSLIATLFSPVSSIIWIVVIAAAAVTVTRQWRPLSADLIAVIVPLAYVLLVKIIVNRSRPSVGVTTPGDPSFPSGHTAAAVSVVALVLLVVPRLTRSALAWIVAAAVAVCVAASRLILGVHFPTDVLTSLIVCPLIIASVLPLARKLMRVQISGKTDASGAAARVKKSETDETDEEALRV